MATYIPAYLWLDDSDDSASDGEVVPRVRAPLGRAARDTLAKLKERTPAHIREVRDYFYDLEECKHKGIPGVHDKNDFFRLVGILITMPDNFVQEILARVKGKGDTTKKLKSPTAKMLVAKLSDRNDKFVDEVYRLWFILVQKRNGDDEERKRMFKDIGLLLQIPELEVHEMIWTLLELIETGENAEDGAQRLQGPGPSITTRAGKYRKRPRHRHPKSLGTLSLEDAPSRPAPSSPAPSRPAPSRPVGKKRKRRAEVSERRVEVGDWDWDGRLTEPHHFQRLSVAIWQCRVCDLWNRRDQARCERENRDTKVVCRGKRENALRTRN
ncbi:hypothetical protein N0V83_008248 [Neocucurbitaria cava]|uniref:Uncharacterized protein n=1 Tax=Neocucurbitaria cava TaxID=798079 RepID=A0A9W8Y299_9PLEO|nr:hypothetical protein N0V83_008248 [Neocucurbitaria cava]